MKSETMNKRKVFKTPFDGYTLSSQKLAFFYPHPNPLPQGEGVKKIAMTVQS